MAPTSTIETVVVARPLKIVALISACLCLLLLIISCASTNWVFSASYRQGLWQECHELDQPDGSRDWVCEGNQNTAWIAATAALVVISIIVVLVGAVFNAVALAIKPTSNKFQSYRLAMYIYFFVVLLMLIAIIVYTVCFMQDVDKREEGDSQWYFGWPYGLAWGAMIFAIGSAILLLIDKDSDEVIYREKMYYHGN